MEKYERIDQERERLEAFFTGIEPCKLNFICPLIQNCAFMKVTLEDLQASINEKGGVDIYQNGANQRGTKASAELQAYNATMKIYGNSMDKLLKLMPKQLKSERSLYQTFQEMLDRETGESS